MKNIVLIDVREQEEWDAGHIDGALHHPLSEIKKENMPVRHQDKDIVLYCRKGFRSLEAARLLKDCGFPDIYSLSGGYEAWVKKSSPSRQNETEV